MKKLIALLIIFSSTCLIAQVKSNAGKITYGVKLNKAVIDSIADKLSKNERSVAMGYINKIKKSIPYIELILEFDDGEATYKSKETMAVDNGLDLDMAVTAIDSDGIYYTDLENKKRLRQRDVLYDNYLVSIEKELIWQITKETKSVSGFTCYKAINFEETEFQEEPYKTIAWFCPELPFQFGPNGFSGLPGLILELVYKERFIFYPLDINIGKKGIKIDKPTEGIPVTQSKLNKLLLEASKSYRE
jgi:GLPGLI family protein